MLGLTNPLRKKKKSPAQAPGRRVLILSVSAGTGHVKAAEALEKVFRRQPGVGEVRHVDALRFTNKLFRDFYSKLYIQLVQKAPTILGFVYRNSDEPWKTDRMRLMLDRLNTGPLERFIARFKPDITVCTHFLPAEIISYLIGKGKLNARLSIVVTDLDVHAMWLCRTFHRYFVALEESKIHLQVLGLPANNITVSGIPIDALFGERQNRRTLRLEAGMSPERPLFLISAGAMGVSPAAGVLESLARLEHSAQAVIICGKNAELKTQLEKQAAEIEAANRHLSFKVIGFTDEMHRWMQMADLYIGKPGGLTTAEAMASGLPMVIVAPIPGQEERNSDHLHGKGNRDQVQRIHHPGLQARSAPRPARATRRHAGKGAGLQPSPRGRDDRRHTPQSAGGGSGAGRSAQARAGRKLVEIR